MVEDRFYEPETKPMDEIAAEAYEKYLEEMESEDGKPMSFEDFKDWFWRY